MRRSAAAASIVVLVALATSAASGFTCGEPEAAAHIARVPKIFEGVVDEVVQNPQRIRVTVLRVFKGRVTRNLGVHNSMDSPLLVGWIPLAQGERTVFYVAEANGSLTTNRCWMFPTGLTRYPDGVRANSTVEYQALLDRLGASEPSPN